MASILKRGDLQWEARIRARIRRKGHPITCKTFTTKSDAEKWRGISKMKWTGAFSPLEPGGKHHPA